MLQLSEKQAQEIVDKMMQDIPYNINIMNEQGIIIGSGQKKRVGTVHQGAVRALQTGRMIEVWQDGRLEKQGTNEPILINQQARRCYRHIRPPGRSSAFLQHRTYYGNSLD